MEFTDFTVIDGTSYPQAVTYYFFSGQNAIETRTATFTAGTLPQPRVAARLSTNTSFRRLAGRLRSCGTPTLAARFLRPTASIT